MKHKVTDANGKIFEFTDSEITDMTTDLPDNPAIINDSQELIDKMKNFQPQIVNSDNEEINIGDFLDSVESGKQEMPSAINVLFEATHSGINKNSWHYFGDSMENDVSSFLTPYNKPMLKNHDSLSEPLGRVEQAYFGKSELNEERDCINVVYKVTDKDAIEKFLDGRYKTSSVGGSVGHIQCGICGKDILKDGKLKFCGHWRGEVYNGQKAVWNARDIHYKEMSVVNNPADDWAQVKKITILSNKSKDSESDTEYQDSEDENNILNNIDSALNSDNNDNTISDSVDNNTNDDADDNTSDVQDSASDNNDSKDNSISIQELTDTVNDLNKKIETKDAEINSLKSQIATLNENADSLKAEKEDIETSLKDSNERYLSLALMQKKLMAKQVADNEAFVGALTKDKYEERIKELLKDSAIELKKKIDDFKVFDNIVTQKTVGTVQNPSLVNNEQDNVIDTTNKDDSTDNTENNIDKNEDEKSSNYKKFEDSIVNSIFR